MSPKKKKTRRGTPRDMTKPWAANRLNVLKLQEAKLLKTAVEFPPTEPSKIKRLNSINKDVVDVLRVAILRIEDDTTAQTDLRECILTLISSIYGGSTTKLYDYMAQHRIKDEDNKKMVSITIALPEELDYKLKRIAYEQIRSVTTVINIALQLYSSFFYRILGLDIDDQLEEFKLIQQDENIYNQMMDDRLNRVRNRGNPKHAKAINEKNKAKRQKEWTPKPVSPLEAIDAAVSKLRKKCPE